LEYPLIEEALDKAHRARNLILDKMIEVISGPRSAISKYAPKIKSVKINIDKIGELIGPGGKNIRRLSRENNVQIDIDDEEGTVSVVAETEEGLNNAVNQIIALTKEIEPGEIYEATVVRIMNFGAFCELVPGKQGLLHISEISDSFVKNVSDHLKEGDRLTVKVKEIDEQGRINLTRKGL
jgi:polyribonucleotide nucleotidyltransferase